MVEGLLALKWNHHHSTFFNVLAGLHNKAKFSDVTLACDGELFPTHKLVLSTCSDYFSTMLDNTQCKAPIIVLKDITKAHLRSLLGYMYLGEVEVHQDDLPDLLKAAECLHIKGLTFNNQSSDTPSTKKQKKEEVANSPSRKSKTIDSVSSPPTKRKKPTPNVESIEKDLLGDSNDVSSETANSKSIDATEKEQELSSKELYDEKEIKVETEEHLYEENTLDVNNLEGTENADNSVGDQDDESTLQEPKVDPLAVFEGAGPSCFPDSLWDQESDNSFGNSNSSGQQQMVLGVDCRLCLRAKDEVPGHAACNFHRPCTSKSAWDPRSCSICSFLLDSIADQNSSPSVKAKSAAYLHDFVKRTQKNRKRGWSYRESSDFKILQSALRQ